MSIRKSLSIVVSHSSGSQDQSPLIFKSPPLSNKKRGISQKCKINRLNSIYLKSPSFDLEKSSNLSKKLELKSQTNPSFLHYISTFADLEKSIQKLEISQENTGFNSGIFEEYQKIFKKIIKKSNKDRKILEKIKIAYETWIEILSSKAKNQKDLENNFGKIKENLQVKIQENENLLKKIKSLSIENSNFGREKEDAIKEVDNIFQSISLNDELRVPEIRDENKVKFALGFKHLLEKSVVTLKDELISCYQLEWNAYQAFNFLKKSKIPIEKIFNGLRSSNLLRRWNEFNLNMTLKPHHDNLPFYIFQEKNEAGLFTFGNHIRDIMKNK